MSYDMKKQSLENPLGHDTISIIRDRLSRPLVTGRIRIANFRCLAGNPARNRSDVYCRFRNTLAS